MRDKLIGLALLVAATVIAWVVIAVGQGHAGGWISALIGPARVQGNPALVETLFSLMLFVPLIVVALIGGAIDKRSVTALGRAPGANLGIGLAVGFAGLTVAMLYAKLAGVVVPGAGSHGSAGLLVWGLAVVALQTSAEEIYFRGWLQPALVARWGTVAGIAAASLAFAGLHIAGGARAPISLVNLFVGGVMFGLFAAQGRGIAGAIGVHFAWNGAEQLAYGLDPNPGIGSFGAIVDRDLAGAAIWGGSTDGLNGSIGMTVVLLAILAPLVLLGWRRIAPPARSAARPAMA